MKSVQDSYLAVDIGGTKTILALYSPDDDSLTPRVSERYPSGRYDGIEPIITAFLQQTGARPRVICLAVAGLVSERQALLTNLPWRIKKKTLHDLGFTVVTMINDMTAVCASLPLLQPQDLHCLQQCSFRDEEVAAVLAPGTGLGEGFLFHCHDGFFPRGGEGGHCDFAPVDQEQVALLEWLREKHERPISYEMVCAGPALGDLYDFYFERGVRADEQVYAKQLEAEDRSPVIVAAARSGSCGLCLKVVELFLRILGREGAHLVLKLYATRGLYLAGGILPRLVDSVSFSPFLQAFLQPGTMKQLLETIPVHIIVKQDVTLFGAACYGRDLIRRR